MKDIKTEKGKKINRKTLTLTLDIERQTMLVNQVHGLVSVVFPEFFACLCVARRQVCFIGLRFRLASPSLQVMLKI